VPRASALRQLEELKPIKCLALPSDQYNKRAKDQFIKENAAKKLYYEEFLYKGIGLIPSSFKYAECVSFGGGEGSWAMYDKKAGVVIIRRDIVTPDKILIHEIVHALQDQHFNLSKIRSNVLTTDQELAITALSEGEAVFIEQVIEASDSQNINISTEQESTSTNLDSNLDCELPEALLNIFMFVYEWGARFASNLSDVNSLDKAYTNLPQSTRDILHPREYLKARHQPTSTKELPLKAPPGYKLLYSDVLGQYVIHALLKSYIPMPTAILAAKGWSGDHIALYENKADKKEQKFHVIWKIRYEDTTDIIQMLTALREYSFNRFGVLLDNRASNWKFETPDRFSFGVESKGREVTLNFNFPTT